MAKKSDSNSTEAFENTTMGLTLFIPVPADPVAAFGTAVVNKGFYLWLMYQGWNVSFRKALVKKVEEFTGVARRQMVKSGVPQVRKTKDGETPILESEKDYTDWLLSEGTITLEDYTALGQEVASTIPVALPGSGESSRKPNKDCYDVARLYLAQIKQGNLNEAALVSGYNAKNSPTFEELGGEANEDTLAKMVQIDEARKERAKAAKKLAGFGAE